MFERFLGHETRKSKIPGTDIERGKIFRFERGEILNAYNGLRAEIEELVKKGQDATAKKEELQKMRSKTNILEKNLDKLNLQYYENVHQVEISTKYGIFIVPVAELNLNKENQETPYIFVGSVGTNYTQSAALSMAMALSGKRVFIPAWPEQAMVMKPDNFPQMLKEQQDLGLHAEYIKKIIEKINPDNKMNVVGCSMGAAVSLTIAEDENFDRIQDLIVLEPPGFEEKNIAVMAVDFLSEGLATLPSAEHRAKLMMQGESSGQIGILEDGRILAKKLFSPVDLAKIHPDGKFEVWAGTRSSIADYRIVQETLNKAEVSRRERGLSPLKMKIVDGGNHNWPFSNSLGVAKSMEENTAQAVTHVKVDELQNSGLRGILEQK